MLARALLPLAVILFITLALETFIFWQWRKRKRARARALSPPPLPPTSLNVHHGETPLPRGGPTRVVELTPVAAHVDMEPGLWATYWGSVWSRLARPLPALSLRAQPNAAILFFCAALVLYLATRFIGLAWYPVYFHGDEAIHTVYANQLIREKGMVENVFLPTYFKNGPKYNLSLSVYLQVLPTLLFGKAIAVTRGTSILLTLIPAVVVAWIVRDFLKLPYWWVTTLLFSVVPVWFLHSRMAFETVLAVSMFAGFLYFYLRYRLENPKSLYAALIFGALTFYAYSPAQIVIVVSGTFLLVFDLRYHLKHWKITASGLVLLAILVLPYVRFRLQVTDPIEAHLRDIESFWIQEIPLTEKLARFWAGYGQALSPGYWYFYHQQDLPRHQMGQYGNLLRITLPFALLGVLLAVKSVLGKLLPGPLQMLGEDEREPARIAYRTLLLALFVAPLPATLAQIGNTRVLTFVLPITILTAAGLITLLQWLENHLRRLLPEFQAAVRPALAWSAFAGLGLGLVFFTGDALRNGPFWHQEYGFGGMQYGAPQVFEKIEDYLASYYHIQVVLTPDWANGSDFLTSYFLDDPYAIEMFSADSLLIADRTLEPNHVVILTPEEYEKISASNKFKSIEVLETLAYPNGKPGFYFLHLAYADNLQQILEEEQASRRVLAEGTLTLDGQTVPVRYSQLDMGVIAQLFDGNEETFIRTAGANPAIFELTFPSPRPLREVTLVIGAALTELTFHLTTQPGEPPLEFTQIVDGRDLPREKVINFGATYPVQTLQIEVRLVENGEPAHVHLWDLWLR
jgi:hypothetical protein